MAEKRRTVLVCDCCQELIGEQADILSVGGAQVPGTIIFHWGSGGGPTDSDLALCWDCLQLPMADVLTVLTTRQWTGQDSTIADMELATAMTRKAERDEAWEKVHGDPNGSPS